MNEISDFTADLVRDAAYYDTPELVTVSDAAYSLDAMRAEGWTLPEGITPESFCFYWNLYAADYIK